MSLPILKASYFCARLFLFLLVYKSSILILFLSFSFLHGMGQWNYTNSYGNLDWVSDVLTPVDSTPHVGFRLRPQDDRRYKLHMKHAKSVLDSNAHSFLSYSTGSVAMQRVVANLVRPINNHQHIEFDFHRNSNPGWLDNSFAREARVRVAFGDVYDRVSYNFQVGGTFGDNEMNGGLRSAAYSISDNSSSTFNSLASDIYSTSSFRKTSDLHIKSAQYYHVNQGDTIRVSLKNQLGINRYVSRFEDNIVSSGLYTDLQTTGLVALIDSSFYWRLEDELSFDFSYQIDSLKALKAQAGLTLDQVQLVQVDQSVLIQNWGAVAHFQRENPSMPMSFDVESTLQGYNAGSFHYNYHVLHNLVNVSGDSVRDFRFYYQFRVEGQRTRLPFIFERYTSTPVAQRATLKMYNEFRVDGGLGVDMKRLNINVKASTRNLDGYSYWDDSWTVVQDTSIQKLLLGQIEVLYDGKDFIFGLNATYQYNERSRIYSFPEWILQGNLDYTLPWLRDRVKIRVGSYARYFSHYFARGYHTLLDMPYVQQTNKYGEYLQVDGYIKFDIKTVGIEIRSVNSTYGLMTDDPLIGPGYSMPPRYFMATFSWRFKN